MSLRRMPIWPAVAGILFTVTGALAQAGPSSDAQLSDVLSTQGTRDASRDSSADDAVEAGSRRPDAAAPPPARRVIDEIVVTATKREESLRDIPASIAAISGEDLEADGAQGLADYLSKLPGVTLNGFGFGGGDSNRMTVRGMGLETNNAQTSNPTGIFIDDTGFSDPFANYVSPDLFPFDLEAVEVLKGPQGTLFGGSALAGLLRYTLQPPALDGWEAKLSSSFGTLSQGSTSTTHSAAVNVPLTKELALRLVGTTHRGSGLIDEQLRGDKDIDYTRKRGWRALGLWQPSSALTVSFTSLSQATRLHDDVFVSNPEGRFSRSNTPEPSVSDTAFAFHNLKFEYALNWADLISSTSVVDKSYDVLLDYSRIGTNEAPPGGDSSVVFDLVSRSDGLMQEFRLVSSSDGPWKWLGGVFAQDYELIYQNDVFAQPSVQLPLDLAILALEVVATGHVRELALFGDVTRHFGFGLDLNLGLRAYRIRTHVINEVTGNDSRDIRLTDQGVNPKLAVTWQARDHLQLYGQIAQGFRYGGVQLTILVPGADDNVPRTYESDTLWNYELGLRTDWLGRTLQADVTLFHIDWTDAQFVTRTPSDRSTYIANVAAVRSQGVELALAWLPPIDGLSLSASAAWLDSRTAAPFEDAAGNVVPPGTRTPGSSDISSSLAVSYTRGVGAWMLDVSVSHAYIGPGFSDLQHSFDTLDYERVDVGLGASRQDLPLAPAVRLNIGNALSETARINAFGASPTDFTYSRPRSVSLQLTAQF